METSKDFFNNYFDNYEWELDLFQDENGKQIKIYKKGKEYKEEIEPCQWAELIELCQ